MVDGKNEEEGTRTHSKRPNWPAVASTSFSHLPPAALHLTRLQCVPICPMPEPTPAARNARPAAGDVSGSSRLGLLRSWSARC